MPDTELIDGVDNDPLPERLYTIKGNDRCIKCHRPLKGKTAYLQQDNSFICRDTGNQSTPTEAILCHFFQLLHEKMTSHGLKLPSAVIKRIDKILQDALD